MIIRLFLIFLFYLSSSSFSKEWILKVGINFNKDLHGKKISKFKVLSLLNDKKEALVLVESDYSKSVFLNHPGVLSVEENRSLLVNQYFKKATNFSFEDNLFPHQWSLKNSGGRDHWGQVASEKASIHIEKVWQEGVTGSKDIVVAVIDSGVDIHHPDLRDNIFINEKEIPNNRIDDDKNGHVDDVHGWNFVDNNNNVEDLLGHGTHCAGIIGASGKDEKGIKGVNWEVSILPISYLDKNNRGNLANAILSIDYAIKMGANIINASWGGAKSSSIKDIIEKAERKGILFVSSAGNDAENLDLFPYYPASYGLSNMITVASTTQSDKILGDSNWGKLSVDLGAPGAHILSTIPHGRYAYMSGTSMAAPHVAGAAALLWSLDPYLDYLDIKDMLMKSVDIKGLYFLNQIKTAGRINVLKAFQKTFNKSPTQVWKKKEYILDSPMPLPIGFYKSYIIKIPGAKGIRAHFKSIDLIPGHERILVGSSEYILMEKWQNKNQSGYSIDVFGESLYLKVISDITRSHREQGQGFSIDFIEYY